MILFSLLFCLLSCLAVAAPPSEAKSNLTGLQSSNVTRLQRQSQQLPNGNFQIPEEKSLRFSRILSKLWDFSKPDKYQYKLTLSCFCLREFAGPWQITVDNGESTAELLLDPDYVNDPTFDYSDEIVEQYGTIDKLYDRVISTLKDGFASASLQVNLKKFILTSVFIDVSEMIADEEFGFSVTNYKKL